MDLIIAVILLNFRMSQIVNLVSMIDNEIPLGFEA